MKTPLRERYDFLKPTPDPFPNQKEEPYPTYSSGEESDDLMLPDLCDFDTDSDNEEYGVSESERIETNWRNDMIDKSTTVFNAESEIDPNEPLYLITYSPDPKRMPDCDFDTQHKYQVNELAYYLRFCKTGLFCVENSQLGRPHYHGWYQVYDDDREKIRIVCIKTFEKFGVLKITKSIGHWKVGYTDTPKMNCLYYYKADLFGQQFTTPYNPITKDTHDNTDWNANGFFFNLEMRKSSTHVINAINQRDYYKAFYKSIL